MTDPHRSVSTSPLKRSRTTPNLRVQRNDTDGNSSEDEETLQLQLAAIEARLKLKKLRGKKAAQRSDALDSENENQPVSSLASTQSTLSSASRVRHRDGDAKRSTSIAGLQVPVSPTRRPTQNSAGVQRSPSRVLLGIDKGLNGKNVSLRRAPSQPTMSQGISDPFLNVPSIGGSSSQRSLLHKEREQRQPSDTKSFGMRIQESRKAEQVAERRRKRIAKAQAERSSAFAVDEHEVNALREAADEQQAANVGSQLPSTRSFSRAEVLSGFNDTQRPSNGSSKAINPNRLNVNLDSRRTNSPLSQAANARARNLEPASSSATKMPSPDSTQPIPVGQDDASMRESFSDCNLSKRILPHSFIERTVEGKKPVLIPDLLKAIQAPNYIIPDEFIKNDFVLFALVASKSAPIDHKRPLQTEKKDLPATSKEEADKSMKNQNGNYIVMTLTDLKWTVDLFLFGPAFVRFRKLIPGTLIAILNPDIMPPPKHLSNTGRWSLKLTSAEETVLEIGTAKDLGWCKSIKKDGQPCGAWVDRRHTEFCEFHINLGVEKLRSGRMEVQGMSGLFGPGGKQGSFTSKWNGSGKGWSGAKGSKGSSKKASENGPSFNFDTRSTYYVGTKPGQNFTAATLLDSDDFMIRGGSAARDREMLAAFEKEKSIAKSLSDIGNGAGADYLRHRAPKKDSHGDQQDISSSQSTRASGRDAKSLGLTGTSSASILLSPLKRKRKDAGDETLTSTKKKTRFITAKGIREAGRDSLNANELSPNRGTALAEDDELDIV